MTSRVGLESMDSQAVSGGIPCAYCSDRDRILSRHLLLARIACTMGRVARAGRATGSADCQSQSSFPLLDIPVRSEATCCRRRSCFVVRPRPAYRLRRFHRLRWIFSGMHEVHSLCKSNNFRNGFYRLVFWCRESVPPRELVESVVVPETSYGQKSTAAI